MCLKAKQQQVKSIKTDYKHIELEWIDILYCLAKVSVRIVAEAIK